LRTDVYQRSRTNRGAALRWAFAIVFGLVVAAGASAAWWMSPSQNFEVLRRGSVPKSWAHLLDQKREAEQAHQAFRVSHHFVPLGYVASDLKLAILVGEDTGFFGHGPIDPEAMWEAVQQWASGERRLRGASTISQQLAKNLFLSNARSWWRKVDEFRLAYWLERELSKRRIFEIYINIIELGPGVYGVDAASQYYFGHGANTLTASEAASLAAAIPGPLHANPKTQTRAWQRRREAIVQRMQHLDILRRWID
jgi:monofunctional biosynthetic peptidoglycan transglycosylase